jgi:hypothetical protein
VFDCLKKYELTLFAGSLQPAGRMWHSATALTIGENPYVVIIGGAVTPPLESLCISSCTALTDAWALQITVVTAPHGKQSLQASWQPLPPLPAGRYLHVAFAYNNRLFFFGGRNKALYGNITYAPVCFSNNKKLPALTFSFFRHSTRRRRRRPRILIHMLMDYGASQLCKCWHGSKTPVFRSAQRPGQVLLWWVTSFTHLAASTTSHISASSTPPSSTTRVCLRNLS